MPSKSTKTEARAGAPEAVLVGVVRRPHGVRGALTVELLSDTPGRFAAGSELALVPTSGARRAVRIESAAPFQGGLLVSLTGVVTRDEAEALRGARFEVPRSEVPPAPAGAHYHFELVGCRCVDQNAGELGPVVEVVADGGGWLLVVERPDGSRLPLPFVDRFLVAVDREARRIEWRLPEGLVEACASRS